MSPHAITRQPWLQTLTLTRKAERQKVEPIQRVIRDNSWTVSDWENFPKIRAKRGIFYGIFREFMRGFRPKMTSCAIKDNPEVVSVPTADDVHLQLHSQLIGLLARLSFSQTKREDELKEGRVVG